MGKFFNINIIRYNTYKQIEMRFFGISLKFKLKNKQKNNNRKEYVDFLFGRSNANFVDITKKPHNKEFSVKPLAFYLPQFHTIPLNNENIEKGFCEWTNVTKMFPQYTGHYQPHLPYDVGFYDLTTDKVMHRQVELAKMYGIYGFCFHYYWFSGGRRLLETPLFNYLNNKKLDLPFCLCWANESWSTQWDGGTKKMIMEQRFSYEDCEKFFYDILPFFKDERYIKINNRPLLIMYNPKLFKKEETIYFVNKMRELSKQNGFDDIFIIGALVFGNTDSTEFGMNGSVEFFPNMFDKNIKQVDLSEKYVNPDYKCIVFDMKDAVDNQRFMPEYSSKVFKTIFPSWDNSARKAFSGGWVFQSTPDLYKKWLYDVIKYTKKELPSDEWFFFINAWNEWAEGAHLEPDRKYGYAYLQTTKEALEENC